MNDARPITPIVFVWDNFGPLHHDRLKAAGEHYNVLAIEVADKSKTYAWEGENAEKYQKTTLFQNAATDDISHWRKFIALTMAIKKSKAKHVFLCNYNQPYIFFTAIMLRLMGKHVYAMQDSKFNDYRRKLPLEIFKSILYAPYNGAAVGSPASSDYLHFLGLHKRPRITGYGSMSIERIRKLAKLEPAPNGTPFKDRHFTIIARLVQKKNLIMAVDAYAIYKKEAKTPRELHIYGNGELEEEIRARIKKHGLEDNVFLHGFVQTQGIAEALGRSLTLILPSIEEQFGNVVIEAQAMGLPIIISEICGACGELVRSGVNGFTINPDCPQSLAFFMGQLSENENLWIDMCNKAHDYAKLGDVPRFVECIKALMEG